MRRDRGGDGLREHQAAMARDFPAHLCAQCAAAGQVVADLLVTCHGVRAWLESFSMPPTSTLAEKQEQIDALTAAMQIASREVERRRGQERLG